MKTFSIYWLNGHYSNLFGDSIEEVFNQAGYSHGSIKAVDWYDESDKKTHEYNKEKKTWEKLETVLSPFTVWWPTVNIPEVLFGTSIKDALKRHEYEEYRLITLHAWEEGFSNSHIWTTNGWVKRSEFERFHKL